ncbi:hypothetical protein A2U01_0084729, partial [Trifolium medium]|nr:hypothetical protein [Trifolium medium]
RARARERLFHLDIMPVTCGCVQLRGGIRVGDSDESLERRVVCSMELEKKDACGL